MKEVSGQWGFGPGSADLPLRWKGRGGFKVDLPAGLYFSAPHGPALVLSCPPSFLTDAKGHVGWGDSGGGGLVFAY